MVCVRWGVPNRLVGFSVGSQRGAWLLLSWSPSPRRRRTVVDGRQVSVSFDTGVQRRIMSLINVEQYPAYRKRDRTGSPGVYYHVCPPRYVSLKSLTELADSTVYVPVGDLTLFLGQ